MTGQVEWRADDDPDGWKLCKMGEKLPVYAHIRTQEDSKAIIEFSDLSIFVLNADSEIVVDTPPGEESKIELVAGNVWANVKKMVKNGSMSVEMNQAVCGIKGTTFVVEDRNGISFLKVIEGEVQFTARIDGKMVVVDGGNMISADQKGLGTLAKFDTAKETATWDRVRTSLSLKSVIQLKIGSSTFTLNGDTRTLDSPPIIKNSRTLVPIRAIIEALGGTVDWDAATKKVTVALGSTTIELWIGKGSATVNGVNTPIDSTNAKVVPEIINGRTMLPLRFVTENLGAAVGWDQSTQTITITYQR